MRFYEKLGYSVFRNDGHRFLLKKEVFRPDKTEKAIRLETERLILRDLTESDFEAYCKLKTDDQTMYYLQDIKLKSMDAARAEFADVLDDMKRTDRKYYFLHMELKDSREQVGSIGYTVTDETPAGKLVHLGYFTYPRFWGNGYMSEALKKVLEYAFTAGNVYRVTTGCLAENIGSERVMQKNGMIREAEHLDYEWHDGKMKTRLEYRLLKNEWAERNGYLKTMKKSYSEMPESLKGNYADVSRDWGFCWKEFVMTVPSPMFLVTTYKANGLTNACMQSWSAFTSANHGKGYYAILGSVNKGGHLYSTLKEKREAVINFFSSDCYDACMATIRHNEAETDEIAAAGLTAEPASWVNAPMIRECFMNLECRYVWEKEIVPGDDHAMICLEVIGAHIDEAYLADKTGEKGLLYNIHYQLNPEHIEKTNHDYAGVIVKKIDMGEY